MTFTSAFAQLPFSEVKISTGIGRGAADDNLLVGLADSRAFGYAKLEGSIVVNDTLAVSFDSVLGAANNLENRFGRLIVNLSLLKPSEKTKDANDQVERWESA